VSSSLVDNPRFASLRRHPFRAAAVLVALLTALAFAAPAAYSRVFPPARPALDCGPGMVLAGAPHACVGVSLGDRPFTAHDPPPLRQLEQQVQRLDARVHGGTYASIVLLMDMSPLSSTDTITYPSLYPNIEGAITAAWQADSTTAFGTEPKIKLYLGNMGSLYGSWHKAVRQIEAQRARQHITAVVGLGQSTYQTRRAASLLSAQANLPVIGATVTGDTMDTDPLTHHHIATFFRVSPPNSQEVLGIARYVAGLQPRPSSVAIIKDTIRGDDYISTLARAAPPALRAQGLKVDNALTYFSGDKPADQTREAYLANQFHNMLDSLCHPAPPEIFFAGRGHDLQAFIQTWDQSGGCEGSGADKLNIVSGDDASAGVGDQTVQRAIAQGEISLTYTTLASAGMWNGVSCAAGAKSNYERFLAAFTGQSESCGMQSTPGSPQFKITDLNNGQAVPVHDAVLAAVGAARADGSGPDQSEAMSYPGSQRGYLGGFTCAHMLRGAGGYVSFGPHGDPVDRPVPVVQLHGNGALTTVRVTWPAGGPRLNLPTTC
jgi:hypothetical protein